MKVQLTLFVVVLIETIQFGSVFGQTTVGSSPTTVETSSSETISTSTLNASTTGITTTNSTISTVTSTEIPTSTNSSVTTASNSTEDTTSSTNTTTTATTTFPSTTTTTAEPVPCLCTNDTAISYLDCVDANATGSAINATAGECSDVKCCEPNSILAISSIVIPILIVVIVILVIAVFCLSLRYLRKYCRKARLQAYNSSMSYRSLVNDMEQSNQDPEPEATNQPTGPTFDNLA